MRKTTEPTDGEAFAQRLKDLLEQAKIKRRGAGAYLAKKYKVSNVTANAWLNGVHKPDITLAKRIAEDHKGNFDELYFGSKSAHDWPFAFEIQRYLRLRPGQRVKAEAALLGAIMDMEGSHEDDSKSRTAADRRK